MIGLNKEPRLRFTDEERSDPVLEKPIRKTEKATARADKAQANIPKKKVRQTVIDPDTGKKTSKLTFEDKKKPPSKLSQGVKEAPVHLVAGKFHKEIRETEQDNVGVESAHKSEEAVETSAYLVREGYRSHKLKPYRKAAQAERQLEKANVNALSQKSLQENTALLPADKDPMGAAIADYFKRHKADRLRVFSSQFDEDEIPVEELFRTEKQMPLLERTALQMATGRILDVGAGSGCHSLTLQEAGKEVHAIDISPLSVEVMKQRGVRSVSQTNLFNEQFADEYDTILMLMNGSGIIGKLENLPDFFRKMKLLLRPGGCVLMDSSNLSYLFEEEDGSIVINLAGDYYGEVDFQMQYKNVKGDSFDWLYIDFQTLSIYAAENGFKAELVKEGTHYDYLAKLSRQA